MLDQHVPGDDDQLNRRPAIAHDGSQRRPSIEPGISTSVSTIRISSRLSSMTIASSGIFGEDRRQPGILDEVAGNHHLERIVLDDQHHRLS